MEKISLNSCGLSCLVIGGGGYVGSFLVPLLLATGRRVTILGRKPAPSDPLPVNTRYVQGSFSELTLIQRLLDEHHEVIHLAYATVPNTSYDNPLGDLLENLPPTVQLFSEAAKRGNRLVLVSSGGTVYGEALSLPITENHPTQPISPYGVTKLTLERYAFLYAATHGLQVVCVRPSNAYGEGQRPFIGQGFIATAMASAILGRPVMVFGEHGGVRDYIHVTDLASGIVAALERGEIGKSYNLGSGQGYSTLDIIERLSFLCKLRDAKIQVVKMNARPFDVRKNVLDSSALKISTYWEPKVDIESGLERTLEWMVNKVIRDE
jgi:UDP-glucose 4-epimerase